jgi:hypothetical protein
MSAPPITRPDAAPAPAGDGDLLALVTGLGTAPDPHAALRRIAALRGALEEAERGQVERALEGGASLAAVGRDLGISRQAVHRRYGDVAAAKRSRPARARVPALPPGDGLALTLPARQVLCRALEEARAAGDAILGGEHVLLALLRARLLPALDGIPLERARTQVQAASTGSHVFARECERPDARLFLTAAAREARRRDSVQLTPELLLRAALAGRDSATARTLRAVGTDPEAVLAGLA